MPERKYGYLKLTGYIFVTCFAVLAVLFFVCSVTYKQYAIGHFPAWVAKATKGKYKGSIADLRYDFFSSDLILKGVRLNPDTFAIDQGPENGTPFRIAVTVNIPLLELDNISILQLLFNHQLHCKICTFSAPEAAIESRLHKVDSSKIVAPEKKSIVSVVADEIDIRGFNISYIVHTKGGGSSKFQLKGGIARLNDWLLDAGSPDDTDRFLLAKRFVIDSSAFSFSQEGLLYAVRAPKVFFSTETSLLSLEQFNITPLVNHDEFYRLTGHRVTIFEIGIPSATFTGIDWKSLLNKKELLVGVVDLSKPDISLYFSYLPPSKPKNLVYLDPYELLRHFPVPLNISHINVTGASIKYTELNDKSKKEGTITFQQVSGQGKNATNIPLAVEKNKFFTFSGTGVLLNQSPFDAVVRFYLPDTAGPYTISAHIANVTGSEIRPAASAMALIKVDSLDMMGMEAHLDGNRFYINSELTVRYKNLKLDLEKPDGDGKLKEKKFETFVARSFVLLRDNPMPGGRVRSAVTKQQRNEETCFFPTIVKNIKSGTKEILARHGQIVGAITNDTLASTSHLEKPKKQNFLRKLFSKKKK